MEGATAGPHSPFLTGDTPTRYATKGELRPLRETQFRCHAWPSDRIHYATGRTRPF